MGAGTSAEGGEGFTLEGLIEQTNRILRDATEIISKCMQSGGNELENFEQRALAQVEAAFASIDEKLSEFSHHSQIALDCVNKRRAEFTALRTTMRDNLLDCYNKHHGAVEKLRGERSSIYNEASQFKIDAQRRIADCMKSGDRLDCLKRSIGELAKKARGLLKKLDALVKVEAEARLKCYRKFAECDRRAIESAEKQASKIIEDIKKCCSAQNTNN